METVFNNVHLVESTEEDNEVMGQTIILPEIHEDDDNVM